MKNKISIRTAAIIAGLSIIIMAIAAGFSVGYVESMLIIPEDAIATATNLNTSQTLYLSGISAWVLIFICDLTAAWGLYIFLKKVNKKQSLITAWLRVIYAVFLEIAIYKMFLILLLVNAEGFAATRETGAEILNLNNEFQSIWSNGLIVFGLHLLGLGYLVIKSGFAPKILGILLLIGGIGYIIIHGGNIIIPGFENYKSTIEMIFMLPMIFGELGLGVWLLARGGKKS
jgi:hypothetical protein